jgi:hypothetical protein
MTEKEHDKKNEQKAKKQAAEPAKDELTDDQLDKVAGGGIQISQARLPEARGGLGDGLVRRGNPGPW